MNDIQVVKPKHGRSLSPISDEVSSLLEEIAVKVKEWVTDRGMMQDDEIEQLLDENFDERLLEAFTNNHCGIVFVENLPCNFYTSSTYPPSVLFICTEYKSAGQYLLF